MFTAVNRTLSGILGKISGDLTDGLQTTDGQTDGPVNWLAAGAGGGVRRFKAAGLYILINTGCDMREAMNFLPENRFPSFI